MGGDLNKNSAMTAVILVGIPATGKSTFCSTYFNCTHALISLDILGSRELEEERLVECISLRQPFIIDNTNVTKESRARYISAAKSGGYRVCGYYFFSTSKDAVARNQLRDKRISDVAIFSINKRLEAPVKKEGFDELYLVRLDGNGGFIVQHMDREESVCKLADTAAKG